MKKNRIDFMGFSIDGLTMTEVLETIKESIAQEIKIKHMAFNVSKFICARKDEFLKESIEACELITADGEGIVLGASFLGKYIPERVTGIDLMQEVVKLAVEGQYKIYCLGATEKVVEETVKVLRRDFPYVQISGFHHGYISEQEEDAICEDIKASGAHILFLGMPTPHKESFMKRNFEKTGVLFCMGVGGSFDVISGKTKRAPIFMQKIGMEWLFRLWQEPGRLWKRYFITNSLFALLLLKQKLRGLWREDGRLSG